MKIFGLTLPFGSKSENIEVKIVKPIKDDVIPEIEEINPGTFSPSEVKSVVSPLLIYTNNGGMVGKPTQRRNIFEPSEYDLYEIGRIEDVDSYVRQSFKKKVGLFLKEGFDYISKDKRAVKYIKTRFAQIEQATGLPHKELIRKLVRSFISKSNAFLVKVRSEKSSGGKVRVDLNNKRLEPVAGYFIAPAETMEIETDGNGRPRSYRQRMPTGMYIDFKPEDVIHFKFDCKDGFIFGTPLIIPVIDDIRALRRIEENVELLIYKHLFPLFQYIVGTETAPAGYTEDGTREIDVVRQEIQMLPSEGSIVTPERHAIKAVGAEGRALRAESYLEHFKKRVFSGLGMSSIDFGEADTTNRSTADNMSRALVDDVKDLQQAFEAQFNQYVISELLLEASFDEDMLLDEHKVILQFKEIDIDKQIKVENHASDTFMKHGTTWVEYRNTLGLDKILVPDDPQNQDPTEFPEWHNTFFKLFHEPEKLISAVDEPYSAAAAAAAESRSTALTTQALAAEQKAKTTHETTIAKARKPVVRAKDSLLSDDYSDLKDIVLMELEHENIDIRFLRTKMEAVAQQMINRLQTSMFRSFIDGFGTDLSSKELNRVNVVRSEISSRSRILISRLSHDISTMIIRRIADTSTNDKLVIVQTIFDTFKYRVDFISDTEIKRAYNLGRIYRATYGGGIAGKFTIQNDTCDKCKEHSHNIVNLASFGLDTTPPHHPNCECGLQITEVKQ